MKNYTITVNGNVYDVTVEETGSTSGAAAPRRTAAKPAAPAAADHAAAGEGSLPCWSGPHKAPDGSFLRPGLNVFFVLRFAAYLSRLANRSNFAKWFRRRLVSS